MSSILDISQGRKVLVSMNKGKYMPGEIVSNGAFWEKRQYCCKVKISYTDLANVTHTPIITISVNRLKAR